MTDFVAVFRALGDANRQRMLTLLEERGEMCVSDVAGHFDLTQPSISHHLRILRQAGLVTSRKRGKEVYYALNAEELMHCCGVYFSRFACCRPLLDGQAGTAPAPARAKRRAGRRR